MKTHFSFYEDDDYPNLQAKFEPPYERLSWFIRGDIQTSDTAQEWINDIMQVLDGTKSHWSMNGNSWWLEVGPETTRMGDMFVKPEFELQVRTRWLVEVLTAFRDAQRARARARRLAREGEGK